MRSVRISLKAARIIANALGPSSGSPLLGFAIHELSQALAPKRSKAVSGPTRRQTKAKKDRTKKEKRQDVREMVAARAGLICECGCGRWFRGFGGAAQMDHFEGVARSESVETCWMLREDCHRMKHRDGNPNAWRAKFINHCLRHGYAATAKKVGAMVAADALIAEAAALSRGEVSP